jgi:hypothetical protein
MVVRFLSSRGPVQQQRLHFQGDSLGFASKTVDYPGDVAKASTWQSGNYTILVQDAKTGTLVERASFEVTKPEDILNFISGIPREVLFPVAVGGVAAFFTYWYNRLSAMRQTKVALNQKKAESFLALRPHYAHVTRSTRRLADGLQKIEALIKEKHYAADEIKRNFQLCFYDLIVYTRERNALIHNFGAYFLSDPRGEKLLVKVEEEVLKQIRCIYTDVELDELGDIISEEGSLQDLEINLGINYRAYHLYEKFKNWIENNYINQKVKEFYCDLKLYSNIINYETIKMFADWYSKKDGINQSMSELIEEIIPQLRCDSRYRSLVLDYLKIRQDKGTKLLFHYFFKSKNYDRDA